MRILLTGRNGQVGWELRRALAPLGDVIACDRQQADLSKPATLARLVQDVRPQVVVNAAAYTAVDAAETEEDLARRVNSEAVSVLADAARKQGALFVHFSTDYVFDGFASSPYVENMQTAPLNVYGRTKLEGEEAVRAAGGDWLTLRTTWVYATRGRNFLRTMLRLASERESLRVVADQIGTPTSARMIADLTAQVVAQSQRERADRTFDSGLFHMTAAGVASWHEFASAIIEAAAASGKIAVKTKQIEPIPSSEYPMPARRPLYSVLNNEAFDRRFGLARAQWESSLALALDDLFSL
jgi:dTDP-4-dehydrorhamnose reductase